MKLLITFLILFTSAIVPITAVVQEDLSLGEALQTGLQNNYGIRISVQNIEISRNNNTWGTAGRYPTINIGVDQTNAFSYQPDVDIPGTTITNKLSPYVNLNWILFNGFRIQITKDKLGLLNQFSEGNSAIIVESTVQAIILAYYNVLLEKEKLSVLEEVQKLSKDRYDYELKRRELGISVSYDVLQAKIAYLSDTSNVLLQQANYHNALRNLNLVLGEPVEKTFNPADTFSAEMLEYKIEDLILKMEESNKTLKNQYINLALLKKDAEIQKSYLYPSLSINSGINMAAQRLKPAGGTAYNRSSYDYYVNFSLDFNLFNGGNTKRAISNAKIQHRIGELEIEELKLILKNQLYTTFELYNVRKQIYEVAEESLKSAALNMSISNEKFKTGAINSFNYRDVQLVYQSIAIERLEAIYNVIDTHTELMRLTGGIVRE
ncbi:MAG: hypothetical protein A2Y62_08895 [Candidatus Fischerbacteria bacterium RBG_13_37_8]|uniref:Transporter n=1 Tax=Candidatus Fischerbacteria bacterium RBG_13_37_8 TaxID=1817863 RepID=A0A1F5VUT1_9BACT|nr:MAG: hypothetical protein A2Y62_08895 [Candidatus Fischerbacteria bacterium RBG_13_37_8]